MIFLSRPVLVIFFWRCLLAFCLCQPPFEQVPFWLVNSAASASFPQQGTSDSDAVEITDSDWPTGLEPLKPLMLRDEFDVDRIHATALFAEARILQQRDNKLAALRKYERSWRYHQNSETLRRLVEIAIDINRFTEAAEYVLLDEGRTEFNDRTLLTLANSQSERKQTTAQIYQLWLNSADDEANDQLYTLVRMETGRLCYDLEEFEKAAKEFQHVLEILDGKSPRKLSEAQQVSLLRDPAMTFNMMADTLLKLGEFTEAESLYRRAHARAANPAKLLRQLARIELLKGNLESARTLLDQSLEEDRDGRSMADSLWLLSEIVLSAGAGEKQAAREVIKAAAPKFEKFPDSELAVCYTKQLRRAGEIEKAIKVLQAEIAELPFPSLAHRELTELHAERNDVKSVLALLASLCGEPSQLKDVAEALNPIVRQDKLGEQMLELVRQSIAAEGVASDEHAAGQAVVGGLLALKLGHYDLAENLLSLASEQSAEFADEISQIQAAGLAAAGQHAAAGKILQSAIDHTDKEQLNPVPWYVLAGHLQMAGESEKAVAAIEYALNIQPHSPMLRFRLGWIHYRAKHLQQAETVFRKLVDDFQSSREDSLLATLRTARIILSKIAAELNFPSQSQEWLEQVLDESPRDPAALNDLGYQWVDRGVHLQRSMRMIELAVAADPENISYQDSLGWALFRLGQFQKAVNVLEQVASADQADGVLLRHLGEAYAADHQSQKALAALRKSIELFGNAGDPAAVEKVRQLIEETTTE